MKILIIGSNQVWSIENFFYKHFIEAGIIVELFPAQKQFYNYYHSSLFNKMIFRMGVSTIYKIINREIIESIRIFKPNIVWVFKGMEVLPQTIVWMKKQGIKVVNYNPDNPFLFTGKGSGNINVKTSIGLYDLHFTYNLEIKKQIEQKYHLPCYWLPFGFEISEELYNKSKLENEIIKASFVGNPDKERAAFFKALANKNIEIDIYGNDWRKYLHNKNITIFNPVYGDDLWIKLRTYRVQLNPLRPHNRDSHGMRSFEVPGIGGIMLAARTTDHIQFFEEGKEAFFYDSVTTAASTIQQILQFPFDQADSIRISARNRSLNSQYSYQDRTMLVLKIIKDIGYSF